MRQISSIIILSLLSSVSAIAQNRIGTGKAHEVYQVYCIACHGADLSGGEGASLIDGEWLHGESDDAIFKVISEGLPQLGMLPYKSVLSPDQIRSLVIYIREQYELANKKQLDKKMEPVNGVFQTNEHNFKLEPVVEGHGIIWAIDFLPDSSIIYTERQGDLFVWEDGKTTQIQGIPEVWQHGQGGLMEVGVHPDYKDNGWIYLGYSEYTGHQENGRDAGMTAIVRGRIEGNQWKDQESIFHVPDKFHTNAGAHFGTRFVFKEDYLYFSIGDRGRSEMAQDLTKPNGKLHRIFDDGRIPKDNPFFDAEDSYRSIWSYGHRNQQGIDLHPETKQIWATEHGPRGGDELNLIIKSKNYGWPVVTYGMNYNGTPITDKTEAKGMEQPIHHWTPSIAACGIDFYEGNQFPKWKNCLFATGLASEELHRIKLDENKAMVDEIVLKNQGRIRDVANGPDGYLYLSLTKENPRKGTIYRIIPIP